MRTYKPLFENRAEESIRSNAPGIYGDITLQDYRNSTEMILKHKDKVNRILDFIKTNNITDEEMKVFNKILGDRSILDKLVFVWDGSYRTQRIFYKKFNMENKNSFDIESDWLYKNRKNKYYKMSTIDKLNFLKNNYDTIFIHLINDEDALMEMLWDDYYDDMSDYDYYDEVM